MLPLILIIYGCKTMSPVSGLNDPLEKSVTVTSEGFSKPLMLMYQSVDPFFRGWIDKSDKAQSHQVYIRVNSGNNFENWSQLVFLKEGQLVELNTVRVSYDVEGNAYYEDIIAEFPLTYLQWIASQESVDMRIKSGRSNLKIDFSISGDEAIKYLKSIEDTLGKLN
jgi:hypothetical protein